MTLEDIQKMSVKIIETEEALNDLIESLLNEKVISFDIRGHTYRSYLGFICILIVCGFLISTRFYKHGLFSDFFSDFFNEYFNDFSMNYRDFSMEF